MGEATLVETRRRELEGVRAVRLQISAHAEYIALACPACFVKQLQRA